MQLTKTQWFKIVGIAAAVIYAAIIILLNRHEEEIRLGLWSIRASLVTLLVTMLGLGFVIGLLVARFHYRRKAD